jgi:hypothetical protein
MAGAVDAVFYLLGARVEGALACEGSGLLGAVVEALEASGFFGFWLVILVRWRAGNFKIEIN